MNTDVLSVAKIAKLAAADGVATAGVLQKFGFPELRYRDLSDAENVEIEARVESAMGSDLRVSGKNDSAVWERGWGEVANELTGQTISIAALRPPYFRGEPTCRLDGRYIRPLDASFEYDASLALRRIVFEKFLGGFDRVAEIGCGTGINLLLLAEQFPQVKLIGCDWATPSRDIVNTMAKQSGRDIQGHLFNMLTAEGWNGNAIDGKTAVLTVHAMEQLASNWQAFAAFVRARRPGLCLHIEPILELYDESPFDDRARRYHLKRGYLQGYLPFLRGLAAAGQIELATVQRIPFGGLYHEAYSIIAWRPRG